MGCFNSGVVSAPVADVWNAISDFHSLPWAKGVIESVEKVGSCAGTQVGAKRVLNGAFHETLVGLDASAHVIRYSIDDGPGAVSKDTVQGYLGEVRLTPITDTGHTLIQWSSGWEAGGQGTAAFCDPIYRSLIAALQKHFGG